jgi:hypothetical protein
MPIIRMYPSLMLFGLALAAAACGRGVTTGALAAGAAEQASITVRPHDFVRRIRLTAHRGDPLLRRRDSPAHRRDPRLDGRHARPRQVPR